MSLVYYCLKVTETIRITGARFQLRIENTITESDIIRLELPHKQTIKNIELKMLMFLKKLNDAWLKNPFMRATQNHAPEDDGPYDPH